MATIYKRTDRNPIPAGAIVLNVAGRVRLATGEVSHCQVATITRQG